ncbi:putative peptidase (DUF1758) domain-containing protein [Phthorimaea operculella]|nr:putative peptidase (DUF1758) domain-containing protein [Phthorimaea operculella]
MAEEELDRKITISQSKVNQFIGRLQEIQTMIPNINDENKQQFLAKARTIDDTRYNFNQELDNLNLYQLTKDPDYQVDFKTLDQFEDLYGEIMLKLDSLRFPKNEETKKQPDHIKIPRIELPTFDDAFKQLKLQDTSEFMFIYMGLKLLDLDTAKQFEMSIRNKTELPTYEEFIKFIREQVKILERTNSQKVKIDHRISHAHVATMKTEGQSEMKCPFIKEKGWCIICLGKQHTASRCQSDRTCRKCKRRHHSLLHFNGSAPTQTALAINDSTQEPICEEDEPEELSQSEDYRSTGNCKGYGSWTQWKGCSDSVLFRSWITETLHNRSSVAKSYIGLLPQTSLSIKNGATEEWLTADCCRKLGLPVKRTPSVSVKGIGGVTQSVKGKVKLTIRSKLNPDAKYEIEALVLELITDFLPTCQIDVTSINNFQGIQLADETWACPGPIDVLLGVKLFAELLLPGKIISEPGLPDALETVLGYIVVGDAPTTMSPSAPVSFCATYEVGNLIKKFWEIEDMGSAPVLSIEDKQAEEFYQSTFKRDETGRYEVALPFKLDPSHLGDSLKMAERRQINLERKFKAQPKTTVDFSTQVSTAYCGSRRMLLDDSWVCRCQ